MKLLVSHRIVLLMVRINWSAFVVLFSVVLSFELFLIVLLGSLSVSFLAFRSASDVDHERAV